MLDRVWDIVAWRLYIWDRTFNV